MPVNAKKIRDKLLDTEALYSDEEVLQNIHALIALKSQDPKRKMLIEFFLVDLVEHFYNQEKLNLVKEIIEKSSIELWDFYSTQELFKFFDFKPTSQEKVIFFKELLKNKFIQSNIQNNQYSIEAIISACFSTMSPSDRDFIEQKILEIKNPKNKLELSLEINVEDYDVETNKHLFLLALHNNDLALLEKEKTFLLNLKESIEHDFIVDSFETCFRKNQPDVAKFLMENFGKTLNLEELENALDALLRYSLHPAEDLFFLKDLLKNEVLLNKLIDNKDLLNNVLRFVSFSKDEDFYIEILSSLNPQKEFLYSLLSTVNPDFKKVISHLLSDQENNIFFWNKALEFENLNTLKQLLNLEGPKKIAHNKGSKALALAVVDEDIDLLAQLLKLPNIVDNMSFGDLYYCLQFLSKKHDIDLILKLLENSNIQSLVPQQKNRLFYRAIESYDTRFIKEISKFSKLSVKEVLELPPHVFDSCSDEMFKNCLFYGISAKNFFTEEFYKEFQKNPKQFFKSMSSIIESYQSFTDEEKPFSYDKYLILRMLDVENKVKKQEDLWHGNTETAMNSIVLGSAAIAAKRAEELYGPLLDEKTLIVVEKEIRLALLMDILNDEKTSQATKDFISNNQEELIMAQNQNLMEEARKNHFKSNHIVQHIAWRAYDQYAPVNPDWPNLLTPPLISDSERRVYAAGLDVAPGNKTSLKTASDISRRQAALYFLALNDASKACTINSEDRKLTIWFQIADIRRAHNKDEESVDNPSCFPGTVGRISKMGAGHPDLDIPDTKELIIEFTKELFSEAIKSYTESMFSNKDDAIKAEKIIYALTHFPEPALSEFKKGEDGLILPNTQQFVSYEELSRVYDEIIYSISKDENDFLNKLNNKLSKRNLNKKAFTDEEKVYFAKQRQYLNEHGIATLAVETLSKKVMDFCEENRRLFESNEAKRKIFIRLYPVFLEKLQGVDQKTLQYLLKKTIEEIEPLPSADELDNFSLESDDLLNYLISAYQLYLKTGYSKEIEILKNKKNVHFETIDFSETLPKEEKINWDDLEKASIEREKVIKLEKLSDEPYKLPAHLESQAKKQGPKSEGLQSVLDTIAAKNKHFLKTYHSLHVLFFKNNISLSDDVVKFLSKKYIDQYFSENLKNKEPALLLRNAYKEFCKTDAFEKEIALFDVNNEEAFNFFAKAFLEHLEDNPSSQSLVFSSGHKKPNNPNPLSSGHRQEYDGKPKH